MAVINPPERKLPKRTSVQCTQVRFASFLSGGVSTMAVINLPERKLPKRTSVHYTTGWIWENNFAKIMNIKVFI